MVSCWNLSAGREPGTEICELFIFNIFGETFDACFWHVFKKGCEQLISLLF